MPKDRVKMKNPNTSRNTDYNLHITVSVREVKDPVEPKYTRI